MDTKRPPKAISEKEAQGSFEFFREIDIQFLIHELKDPLAIVETGMRTLMNRQDKYGKLSSLQQAVLKRSLRSTLKARAMVNGLLEIGRSESGNVLPAPFNPFECACRVLLECLEASAPEIYEGIDPHQFEKEPVEEASQHGIYMEIPPHILKSSLHQDETRYLQILGNLFKNAIRYRRERIEIRMNFEDELFWVDVIDDGEGIDPEHHEVIFKCYTRLAECSLPQARGHGLGLAGARIMARYLGGDIHLWSHKGGGSRFRLTLPRVFKATD